MVSITFFNTYLNGITDRENLQPYTYKKIRVTASACFFNIPAKLGGRSTRTAKDGIAKKWSDTFTLIKVRVILDFSLGMIILKAVDVSAMINLSSIGAVL